MLDEQLFTQIMLPADATNGAAEVQQIFPETYIGHVAKHVKVDEFK